MQIMGNKNTTSTLPPAARRQNSTDDFYISKSTKSLDEFIEEENEKKQA